MLGCGVLLLSSTALVLGSNRDAKPGLASTQEPQTQCPSKEKLYGSASCATLGKKHPASCCTTPPWRYKEALPAELIGRQGCSGSQCRAACVHQTKYHVTKSASSGVIMEHDGRDWEKGSGSAWHPAPLKHGDCPACIWELICSTDSGFTS